MPEPKKPEEAQFRRHGKSSAASQTDKSVSLFCAGIQRSQHKLSGRGVHTPTCTQQNLNHIFSLCEFFCSADFLACPSVQEELDSIVSLLFGGFLKGQLQGHTPI